MVYFLLREVWWWFEEFMDLRWGVETPSALMTTRFCPIEHVLLQIQYEVHTNTPRTFWIN